MIFVNFKTYPEVLRLAEICLEVEKETGVKIWPVIKPTDLASLAGVGIEVWLQYWDEEGAGAKGVILNHADYPLAFPEIQKKIEICRKNNLRILICADDFETGQTVSRLKPDLIAFEPPELIGGDISVSRAKPEMITNFIQAIPGIPILVGAGINQESDVKKALKMGAVGILVSKAVVEADDLKAVLLNLVKGFKS